MVPLATEEEKLNEDMKNKSRKHLAVHPGRILKMEIEARCITPRTLADIMRISPRLVWRFIDGRCAVTADMAEKLEAALGIRAQNWLAMQSNYDRLRSGQ